MKRSFIILLFHLLSLVQPYSLQSQTTIIKVDDFLYEKGIQLIEEIIISSVPEGNSLITEILLKGIQDILPEYNSFVIIKHGKANYEKDPIRNVSMNKGDNKVSFSVQIKEIESKAKPGYGLFGLDPYLFQK